MGPLARIHWNTIVCIASGTSLTAEQLTAVSGARDRGLVKTIVVNLSWEKFPESDILYACDTPWWNEYGPKVCREYRGECWTRSLEASETFGVNFINSIGKPGLSCNPAVIHEGGNGGYQAINLAFHLFSYFGPRRIVLLGYDMKEGPKGRKRHHPDYPPLKKLSNSQPFASWLDRYGALAKDLKVQGVDVVNCSPGSALKCFRLGALETELEAACCPS